MFINVNRCGKSTIDRFADDTNHNIDRFDSKCWVPGT